MSPRPSIKARDSSGKQVSLLNDEQPSQSRNQSIPSFYPPRNAPEMSKSLSSHSSPRGAASPPTPALMRADSFDSQNTSDALSPVTPHALFDLGRQPSSMSPTSFKDQNPFEYREKMQSYDEYSNPQYSMAPRPSFGGNRASSFSQPQVYDEESYHNNAVSDRGQKRYSCRYKEALNCEKTFTTSGHASRHSKIHTAEKAVPCTFKFCQKKFTRNDNMKQHLETHYKDRTRSSTIVKSGARPSALTTPASVKKPGGAGRSRPSSRNAFIPEVSPVMDPALFSPQDSYPIVPQAPYSAGTESKNPFSPAGFEHTLPSRPITSPTSSTNRGLDVLVMAVEQSQQASRAQDRA
ncbi:hypothetical protein G7Y89_g14396 [Cudoniella acicularis]|uniref:C2H2-type domain-containing protein n=1 Tax=Cudoniella acicularis TaxID=354080 RepID=A0A8H4R216_9HELO|nr:hypothetical protein G7Y89_g14396 [Cudoniella acicularis]